MQNDFFTAQRVTLRCIFFSLSCKLYSSVIIIRAMAKNEKFARARKILRMLELISSDAKKRIRSSVHPCRACSSIYSSGRAYFYGVSPSSNSRHSAATERNYHIGARVQAGKRTLFVLRLDLLRPSSAFLQSSLVGSALSFS